MAFGAVVQLILVAVALIGVAYALSQTVPKGKKPLDVDTALTTRGSFIPVLIGRQAIKEWCFGWAGNRTSESQGGGGKGFGGGGAGGQAVWFEDAWHQICVGPASILYKIIQNGVVIWDTPVYAGASPSGSSFTLPNDEGTFTIWWGEIDQPINEWLVPHIGQRSRHPYLCYITWTRKKLGGSPVWPPLTYVMEAQCLGSGLQDSDAYLDDGTSKGINGGHVMLMLMNAKFPHGRAVPNTQIDNTTLEAFGVLCEAEHLPMNYLIKNGETFESVIGKILLDHGVQMPQINGRLAWMPVRTPTGAIPELTDDTIVHPDLEREIDHGDVVITRSVFTYKNERLDGYKDKPIVFDEDAEAGEYGSVASQNFEIFCFTNTSVASKAARRRWQESTLRNGLRVVALRGARQLVAGQVFDRTGYGRLRVMSKQLTDDTAQVVLTCTLDSYSVPDIDDVANETDTTPAELAPENDIQFTWFELPTEITSDVAISVVRMRSHQQMVGSIIWVSANGSSYSISGHQDYAASGGALLAAILASGPDVLAIGPMFEAHNKDAANILDLTGDDASWMSGRQIVTIDDEVLFLQSVTVQAETGWLGITAYSLGNAVIPVGAPTGFRYVCTTAGTSANIQPVWPTEFSDTVVDGTCVWEARGFLYAMNNLIRARHGSAKALHAIGAVAYIADSTQLRILTHPVMTPGVDLSVKSVPFSGSASVDIAGVTAVTKTLVGHPGGIASGPESVYRVCGDGSYRIASLGENRTTSE